MQAPAKTTTLLRPDASPTGWAVSAAQVDYQTALAFMEARAAAIAEDRADEMVWLLEHPPLYTAGISARPADLLAHDRFPVFKTSRGGQYTYHGPGQRVAYVMLNLARRGRDIHAYVGGLEDWLMAALAALGVAAERRCGRIGVWVTRPGPDGAGCEDKIAAIGVRVRRWVSLHGVSLNVAPDLEHFSGIVPCGITDHGVTSLAHLGVATSMAAVDKALKVAFSGVFGPIVECEAPSGA